MTNREVEDPEKRLVELNDPLALAGEEIQNLLDRRRELATIRFAAFAALLTFLDSTLSPPRSGPGGLLQQHPIEVVACILFIVLVATSFRDLRIAYGLVRNNRTYFRLVRKSLDHAGGDKQRSVVHFLRDLETAWVSGGNIPMGLSAAIYLWGALLAMLPLVILLVQAGLNGWLLGGLLLVALVLARRLYAATVESAELDSLEKDGFPEPTVERAARMLTEHTRQSLGAVNKDMMGLVQTSGLACFSILQCMKLFEPGAGAVSSALAPGTLLALRTGSLVAYSVVSCLSILLHIRLRIVLGRLSLFLYRDPEALVSIRFTDSTLSLAFMTLLFGAVLFIEFESLLPTPAAVAIAVIPFVSTFVVSVLQSRLEFKRHRELVDGRLPSLEVAGSTSE